MIVRIFKALFGKNNLYVRRNPDPSLGLVVSETFGDLLTITDFETFTKHFEPYSWDIQMLILDDMALGYTFTKQIRKWHQKSPNSHLANLFYGTNMIFLAWEARSGALADEVKDSQWSSFFDYLNEAKKALQRAIELNPNHAEAYTRMLQILMGEGASKDTKMEYYEKAIAIEPLHIGAYLKMIANLSYKWGGSREEMYNFAIEGLEKSNRHPLFSVLPLYSFVEDWVKIKYLDEDNDGAKAFWKEENVRNTVYTLFENQNDFGELSILKPIVNNYFLFIFHRMMDWEKANILWKRHTFMTEKPWVYIGIEDSIKLSNYLTKK